MQLKATKIISIYKHRHNSQVLVRNIDIPRTQEQLCRINVYSISQDPQSLYPKLRTTAKNSRRRPHIWPHSNTKTDLISNPNPRSPINIPEFDSRIHPWEVGAHRISAMPWKSQQPSTVSTARPWRGMQPAAQRGIKWGSDRERGARAVVGEEASDRERSS